jgi:hypothetical protein
MMLSALSATQAVTLGGSNAAAQPSDVPPPPPPAANAGPRPVITAELIGILIWIPLIALALTSSGPSGRPNSPA